MKPRAVTGFAKAPSICKSAAAGPGALIPCPKPDILWDRCDIKSIALLPNVLVKQAARE